MKDSTFKLLVIVLSLIIVIGGSMLLYQNLSPDALPQTDESVPGVQKAPDFTVIDASEGSHSLSDFRGKPVVLNFWSSKCGPCRQEMPDFQKAWEKYGEEVEFLMVNITDGYNDTFRAAMELLEQESYTFPAYFDTEGSAAIAYGIHSMPTSFFLDAEGNLVSRHIGMMTAQQLEEAIAGLLAD